MPRIETNVALPAAASAPTGFAGLRRGALDIEEIVGDLKGEPEIMCIAAQGEAHLRAAFARIAPASQGKRNQRPRFMR